MLGERERGLTLAAVRRRRAATRQVGAQSLFAELRSAHPHLDPLQVSMRVMLSLTWAIEDECLAHASRPVLFGCFQDQQGVPASPAAAGASWRARPAGPSCSPTSPTPTPTRRPARVALPTDSPMLNEWAVICLDPQLSAVLVAWEPPRRGRAGAARKGERRFEGLLSLEPDVARDAVSYCTSVCADLGLEPTWRPGPGS